MGLAMFKLRQGSTLVIIHDIENDFLIDMEIPSIISQLRCYGTNWLLKEQKEWIILSMISMGIKVFWKKLIQNVFEGKLLPSRPP